jgi:hypothetical protein
MHGDTGIAKATLRSSSTSCKDGMCRLFLPFLLERVIEETVEHGRE